jgi:serine/threonine protein kinase
MKIRDLVLLCCFVLFRALLSHGADMPLGSTLSPGSSGNSAPWSSPNNTFSLSFTASPTSPSLFVASIAYSGGVPVWSAGSGAAVDSGGSLRLTSTGDLQLVNGSGAVLWASNTGGRGVVAAAVQESGNLLLKNSSASALWQSFEHPTDTVVMSQNFTSGMNLTSGPYVFTVDRSSGNLTLQWAAQGGATVTYFNKGYNSSFTANRTLSAPTLAMQTNGIVSLTDGQLSSPVVVAYSSNYGESGDMLRFVRLDSDGNFRAYSATRGSNAAAEQWSAVADQCLVFGYCGNMGVCGYNGTSPTCGCPSQNFELNDPSSPRDGCRRKVELQNCQGNSTMLALDNTQFLTYPPEITTEQFFVGITACRLNCLSGSSCVASTALSDGSGLCFLKVSTFVSAYQSAALPSTSFVKVCSPGIPNPTTQPAASGGGGSGVRGWVVAVVVLGAVAGLVLCEWVLWRFFCRHSPKYGPASAQYALLEYASGAPVQFPYRELQRSTKGFKEKLGAGGFGAVYRGVLANRTVVAVKQLEGIEQGEKQFRMEVATISSTHHLNLVRLIGFCSEGRHRLLVYEFMKNGSLDAFLFGADPPGGKLPWPARFAVAVGTARGITYLHEECRDCIVHCDIKPENILLDDQHNAKVSDFGLAKLVNPKEHRHRTLSSVRGTRGYLAPEWLANLPITAKSDVYSYGMVLLEVVSGRRNFDVSEETSRKKFSVWAYEEYDRGNVAGIMDRKLPPEEDVDMAQVHRALQVSFWCIQEQPAQRPSMGKVVQMLEGIAELERPPPPKSPDSFLSVTTATSGVTTTSMVSTFASSAPVAPAPPNLEQEEISLGRSASANRDRVSRTLLSPQPYMTM